ncbi:MAG: hypothetical protein HY852_12890 [Bradyrhizobium sp.]|uniref:DUF6498-containing protein n=1 Tax=Bradyrhizobium sp. TaxID=376 RepID=UPI0025C6177C|nr:DUF6498-containing protein [Bradyrhizobium sp.]MBI5262700.1 hypothetical protein [Bradyrhizobium sp.]
MPILLLHNLLTIAANALPVYGLFYLGVDSFQVLMLYWMETAIVGFWMVLTLARLPESMLGAIKVNGQTRRATNKDLVELFGMVVLGFMAVHLLFLWVLFSGDWPRKLTGPGSFVHEFIVASGAWAPLVLMFVAGFFRFCASPARPRLVDDIEARLTPNRRRAQASAKSESAESEDGVAPVVAGTLGRIVMMQVGIILGAMLVRAYGYGSQTPLLIFIGLKTLFEMRRR